MIVYMRLALFTFLHKISKSYRLMWCHIHSHCWFRGGNTISTFASLGTEKSSSVPPAQAVGKINEGQGPLVALGSEAHSSLQHLLYELYSVSFGDIRKTFSHIMCTNQGWCGSSWSAENCFSSWWYFFGDHFSGSGDSQGCSWVQNSLRH